VYPTSRSPSNMVSMPVGYVDFQACCLASLLDLKPCIG
jgi:hypothetical protein